MMIRHVERGGKRGGETVQAGKGRHAMLDGDFFYRKKFYLYDANFFYSTKFYL